MSGATSGSGERVTAGTDGPRPSRDAMFDLLGNARRRYVLRYLLEEGPVTLRDLSARIAARENGSRRADLSSRQRKQVYSSLYQTHLPRLSTHGLVEYDSEDRYVRLTGDPEHVERFLALDRDGRTRFSYRWSWYFFLTAVVGSGVILGHWLGTTPADRLTTESLYGLLTVVFMMLSVSFVMAVEGRELLRRFD